MKKKLIVGLSTGLLILAVAAVVIVFVVLKPFENKHTHDYMQTVTVTKAATCTQDGVMTYTCSCGDIYTEKIPATGHKANEAVKENEVAATCTTAGKEGDTVCEVCGKTLSTGKEIPALGHSWNEGEVTTEPTCTEAGVKTFTCTVCGETKTEEVAALGHTEAIDAAVASTCTETGLTEGSHCSVCGAVMKAQEVVPATGHTWNNGVVTKGATCTAKGVKTYTCAVCGETKTEVIAAKGHTAGKAVKENEVAATCTKDGSYDSVVYCSVCNAEISRQTVTIAATGHTSVSADNAVAATCTSAGKESDTVCSVCGETLSTGKEISATGHTPAEAVKENEVAATCTEDGSYDSVVYCSVCNAEISREKKTVTALGHSWDEGEVTTEPTCTEAGVKTFTCTVCGETKTEPVSALGHDYDTEKIQWTWNTDHTSATATLTCKNDETHTQTLEATVKKTTALATCEEAGLITYTASITFDGKSYTNAETETLLALGHDYIDGVCTVCGYLQAYDLLTFTLSDDGTYYSVTDCDSSATEIYIPSAYNDLSVTNIGSWAFEGCTSLQSITIPDSVTSIGDSAFFGCYGLTSVTIGNGVTSIGFSAFAHCSRLTSIDIPDSVTSIGEWAFTGCSRLTSLIIPDSVTSIGSSAFMDCNSMTSIKIGKNVTSIGSGAFAHCSRLTSITVDEDNGYYKSIDGTLYSKDGTTLIRYAIKYAIEETDAFKIPDGVTSIGDYAFDNCNELTGELVIPDSVTSIGYEAFIGCTSLTSLTIGKNVTSIGEWAFYVCYNLTSVTIGENVKSIGSYAFDHCSGLTSVFYKGSAEDWSGISIGTYNTYLTDATRYYYSESNPFEGDNAVESGNYWHYDTDGEIVIWMKPTEGLTYTLNGASYSVTGLGTATDTDIVIPSTYNGKPVTAIGSNAFVNNMTITSIVIPDSVTSIGSWAFKACSGLTSITIGNGVTNIGEWAFYECSGLTSIVIPDGVTSIGSYAFYVCTSLTSVTIGSGVESIGELAFYGCTALTSISVDGANTKYKSIDGNLYSKDESTLILIQYAVSKTDISFTIPDEVTSIEVGAFYKCASLESVTIGDGVTEIGSNAFYQCTSLKSVTIGNSVTSIGDYAFIYCTSLESITIGNSVTSIGVCAFQDCTKLTSIVIPDSVTSIGGSAFSKCSGLTSIVIPDGVTSIGNYVFSNCSGLTSITIGNGVTSIDSYAFNKCSGLTSVTIGNKVTSIGSYAFQECTSLTSVYYMGSAEDWSGISIGTYNTYLTDATRYYYSEENPFEGDNAVESGNYWHYVNGEIVVWIKETEASE